MLLAIDIGNTTTGFAVIQNGRILSTVKVDTASPAGTIKTVVEKIFKHHTISRAVICSVVPKAQKLLENILSRYY